MKTLESIGLRDEDERVVSTIIELLQLITKRGLFEFDDIIHNTLGALIGIALLMAGKKVIAFFESRLEKK